MVLLYMVKWCSPAMGTGMVSTPRSREMVYLLWGREWCPPHYAGPSGCGDGNGVHPTVAGNGVPAMGAGMVSTPLCRAIRLWGREWCPPLWGREWCPPLWGREWCPPHYRRKRACYGDGNGVHPGSAVLLYILLCYPGPRPQGGDASTEVGAVFACFCANNVCSILA